MSSFGCDLNQSRAMGFMATSQLGSVGCAAFERTGCVGAEDRSTIPDNAFRRGNAGPTSRTCATTY